MVDPKFYEHFGWIYEGLPDFDSLFGFLFYSFLGYLMVIFFGWLLNPTVDEIISDDMKQKQKEARGKKMR